MQLSWLDPLKYQGMHSQCSLRLPPAIELVKFGQDVATNIQLIQLDVFLATSCHRAYKQKGLNYEPTFPQNVCNAKNQDVEITDRHDLVLPVTTPLPMFPDSSTLLPSCQSRPLTGSDWAQFEKNAISHPKAIFRSARAVCNIMLQGLARFEVLCLEYNPIPYPNV